MKTVLCIGGLDPAGRAGLLADVRAVTAMGCRPLCVATALTYQSSRSMDGYFAVDAATVQRQLAPLLRDEAIAAIKVGQLASAENAACVARMGLDAPLVLDTPLVSSSGRELFPRERLAAYGPLLERAALVTPNSDEARLLATMTSRCRALLLKGGHIPGDTVTDELVMGEEHHRFSGPRLPGRFRGTGCRLASAIAARLAQGDTLPAAVGTAREWLQTKLRSEG